MSGMIQFAGEGAPGTCASLYLPHAASRSRIYCMCAHHVYQPMCMPCLSQQDLSPKYSSAMLGLTNVSGSVPGIVGVALTGLLLDTTDGSWEVALFAPSILCLAAGAVVYTKYGRNDTIDLDAANNSPFGWEDRLKRTWGEVSQKANALAASLRK